MELAEAIKRLIPLQVVLPDRRHPLTTVAQYAAEVFLADTTAGAAVIWLDPFWCQHPDGCHIAYAQPRPAGQTTNPATARAVSPTRTRSSWSA
jgi:hypothetical protein